MAKKDQVHVFSSSRLKSQSFESSEEMRQRMAPPRIYKDETILEGLSIREKTPEYIM